MAVVTTMEGPMPGLVMVSTGGQEMTGRIIGLAMLPVLPISDVS